MAKFDADILRELRDLREVAIRTEKHPDGAVVIWVVVADDEVFVRSWRGAEGRWYRDLAAGGPATLEYAGRRLAGQASPALGALFQGQNRTWQFGGQAAQSCGINTGLARDAAGDYRRHATGSFGCEDDPLTSVDPPGGGSPTRTARRVFIRRLSTGRVRSLAQRRGRR